MKTFEEWPIDDIELVLLISRAPYISSPDDTFPAFVCDRLRSEVKSSRSIRFTQCQARWSGRLYQYDLCECGTACTYETYLRPTSVHPIDIDKINLLLANGYKIIGLFLTGSYKW